VSFLKRQVECCIVELLKLIRL